MGESGKENTGRKAGKDKGRTAETEGSREWQRAAQRARRTLSWTIDEISGQKLENFIQENDGKAESEDTLPLGPVQSLQLEEVLAISRRKDSTVLQSRMRVG